MHSNPNRSKVPATTRAAQAIMLLPLGAVVVYGGTYFGFFHQLEPMHFWEYSVAVWAIAQGALAIFTATRLGKDDPFWARVAVALMAGHFAFGIVKLAVWQETAAIPFMTLDLAVIALLQFGGATRRRAVAAPRARRGEVIYVSGVGFDPLSAQIVVP